MATSTASTTGPELMPRFDIDLRVQGQRSDIALLKSPMTALLLATAIARCVRPEKAGLEGA